jgi:hypothetical protein
MIKVKRFFSWVIDFVVTGACDRWLSLFDIIKSDELTAY